MNLNIINNNNSKQGIVSTVSYRICKIAIENIELPEISFDASIVHCLISNFTHYFSIIEKSIAKKHTKASSFPMKRVPDNQKLCLEVLSILSPLCLKFQMRKEILEFELDLLFLVSFVANSPVLFFDESFIPIIAKTFELFSSLIATRIFDRISNLPDHQNRFLYKLKLARSQKFQGIIPCVIKSLYISKLELVAFSVMRLLISTPVVVHPLLYPSNHELLFLGLTPWIISQSKLFPAPNNLAYFLLDEMHKKSASDVTRQLANIAKNAAKVNQDFGNFIDITCSTLIPSNTTDFTVLFGTSSSSSSSLSLSSISSLSLLLSYNLEIILMI